MHCEFILDVMRPLGIEPRMDQLAMNLSNAELHRVALSVFLSQDLRLVKEVHCQVSSIGFLSSGALCSAVVILYVKFGVVLVYMHAGQVEKDIEKLSDEVAANFAFFLLQLVFLSDALHWYW
ncbi:hypothetical protein Tco_1253675 [Tanacetum coccineum]